MAQLQSQARTLQTQVSSFGQMSSLFSSLQTAANRLTGSSLWTQSKATSSDEAVAQVVGGGNAAAGSYAVSVGSLATSQTVVGSTSLASATEAGLALPLSEAHRQILERAEALGWGEFDNSALVEALRPAATTHPSPAASPDNRNPPS